MSRTVQRSPEGPAVSRIVFARYRAGMVGETRRVSHVFRLPAGDELPDAVESLCSQRFPAGVLESVPPWSGTPCMACTLRIPTGSESGVEIPSASAPDDRTGAEPPGEHVYGAAFTGESLRHIVPERTQRCLSLGKTVAVSECGHLAYDWTDGTCRRPPRDWSVCAECAEHARNIVTVRTAE